MFEAFCAGFLYDEHPKLKSRNGKHLKTTLPWIKYFWSWIKVKRKAWLTRQILSARNFKV